MEITFANLIAPLSVDEFFDVYWEKKLLHLKRDQANFFDDILSVKDIDDYLQRQDLSPLGFRLAVNGNEIDQREWTKESRLLHGTVKTVVNAEKVFDIFTKGATLIINSAQTGIPALGRACRLLEQEFKFSLQSNIYITPPNSQGFAKHYDPHDILALQLKGQKHWRILDSGEELPTKLKAFRKTPELVKEFQMQAGDLLYIPRGTVHEAFASREATMHVNFSFKPRYGFHLLEDLVSLAEKEDMFFRKTIPNGFASEADKQKYLKEFSEKASALLEKYSSDVLLENQFERFVETQQVDFKQRFADVLSLENITSESIVSRRQDITISINKNANGIRIKFAKNEIIIPKFIQPDKFLGSASFSANEIVGLITDQGKVELVKEFIQKGYLKIESL